MNFIPIYDLSDARVSPYCHLSNRQLRSSVYGDCSLSICESLLVIREAFARGVNVQSLLISDNHVQTIARDLPCLCERDLPIFVASAELLSSIAGFSVTRGYFACVKRPSWTPLSTNALRDVKTLCVLENFRDVSNVGATIRNALALGVDAMLLSPECADPFSRRSIRTSMGTVFGMPMFQAPAPWPAASLECLKAAGFYLLAMALQKGALPLNELQIGKEQKLALLFGNEGTGLSAAVLDAVDACCIIPMDTCVDSLNVAASTAISFWELRCARSR